MHRVFLVAILLINHIGQIRPASIDGGNALSDSAGMAAFFQFEDPTILNSNLLTNLFRTFQISGSYLTADWPVPGYEFDNQQDVKVLIHNAGWVVAYYAKERPVSNILDFDGAPHTRLSLALEKIAWAMDVTPAIHYTNFQYPQAEHMLRTGRLRPTYAGTNSFEIRLPSTNTYYQRAWYLRATSNMNEGRFHLDGRQIGSTRWCGSGIITESDMVQVARHVIGIESAYTFWGNVWGELVLLYSGPGQFTIDQADTIQVIDLSPAPDDLLLAAADLPRYFAIYLSGIGR